MIHLLKNLLATFGVDRAIFYTSSTRVIQALGGLVTLFLIATFMTKEEQGFYYTFGSVLAIQIFFELGLGSIISQFVAHEMAHLSFKSATEIEGNIENLSRLTSLMHFCLKWYIVFASMLFVTLQIAGYYFFSKYGGNNPGVHWQIPWIIIAFGSSLNLLISPWMAVLQGMSKVKEMARLALIQQLAIMTITWISLLLGAKLYILAINSFSGFVILAMLYSRTEYPRLLLNTYQKKIIEKISYWNEIFPYQWRIALSWISGYFIFQLFNPVLFATEGVVVAGQMGMTLVALNGISSLSMAWITVKVPLFSRLIAQRKFLELDTIFNKTLKQTTLINFSSLVLLGFVIFLIRHYNIEIKGQLLGNRFLNYIPMFFMMIPLFINQFVFAWAVYLRCHKKEPLLLNSIVLGILCSLSTIFLGKYYGVMGITFGYSFMVFIMAPWSYWVYKTKKQEWHSC